MYGTAVVDYVLGKKLDRSELLVSHYDFTQNVWVVDRPDMNFQAKAKTRALVFEEALSFYLKDSGPKQAGRPRTGSKDRSIKMTPAVDRYLNRMAELMGVSRSCLVGLMVLKLHSAVMTFLAKQQALAGDELDRSDLSMTMDALLAFNEKVNTETWNSATSEERVFRKKIQREHAEKLRTEILNHESRFREQVEELLEQEKIADRLLED